jgi:inner membrane protein
MSWWAWALVGLGLLAAEVVTPGAFFFLFFGLGALVVAGLAAAAVVLDASGQWLSFSLVSVALLAMFRRPLVRRIGSARGTAVGTETIVGEAAVLLDDLPAHGVGKAELRGTTWSARSRATALLARGTRCRVERVEGLTLWIYPEQAQEVS